MKQETFRPMIVAVDGPAGSGKSSVCAKVAQKMGWTYVNTGAIYRAVGIVVKSMGVDVSDEQKVAPLVAAISENIDWNPENQRLFYDGRDLTDELGTVEASRLASHVARMSGVREKLLDVQRRLAMQCPVGAIVDGRDIGTVIFPDANLKVFMTASLDERAQRRYAQLGEPADYDLETIKNDIASRDEQDSGRDAAPLKQAGDAVVFDTSGIPMDGAVNGLIDLINEKIFKNG